MVGMNEAGDLRSSGRGWEQERGTTAEVKSPRAGRAERDVSLGASQLVSQKPMLIETRSVDAN